jgi:pyruvate, orthophosphate dikinase
MIFAADADGRRASLARLLPAQRADFLEIFTIMEGLPVTIRLLDPPLHEFLPHTDADIAAFAAAAQMDEGAVRQRLSALAEANPMLGHRGCRLGVTCPEIYEMQVTAILEAALQAPDARPEIMIPLVASRAEMLRMRALVDATAQAVFARAGRSIDHLIGTMIELPRAALRAAEIAENAAFFSFGTNDLTQTTFGMSRDDAASFLPAYVEGGLLEADPFARLDVDGVGELVRIAAERGRATRPDIKLGICGEHGGDPASIAFCEAVGLDYVSCSPYRVPIARLAAAQAAIRARAADAVPATKAA